jgi:hypothetical protein
LRSAARAFGTRAPVPRARCVVAEAEVALAARDLAWDARALAAARAVLEQRGDGANAAHARYLEIRRLLLIGRLAEAERTLALLDPESLPPALRVSHELGVAGIAIRRLRIGEARAALSRSEHAARVAGIPALNAEVAGVLRQLREPAARLVASGEVRTLVLEEVEALLTSSNALVVDACRYVLRGRGTVIAFAKRPVLFTLARVLAEAWPADVARDTLVARAFRLKPADESHRARLRVEVGRLRRMLSPVAEVSATKSGFRLAPRRASAVLVLAPPVEEKHPAVLAVLADGESWSTSALALALGTGQRSVQRTLDTLAAAGKVQAVGRGRARRWMRPPAAGFTTTLLLPAYLDLD